MDMWRAIHYEHSAAGLQRDISTLLNKTGISFFFDPVDKGSSEHCIHMAKTSSLFSPMRLATLVLPCRAVP